MKAALVILGVLVLAAIALFGGLMSSKNQLTTEREAIHGAFAQVDVVMQRRADLIPNLVETVKGFATHEEKVVDDVASARAAMMGAKTPQEKIQANSQIDSALGRLFVVVENYPNIKADENFLRLQDELSRSENRIAVERRKYNEVVQKYNTDIALFPNNIAAGIFGFQREDAYFKADEGAKQVPKVKF
jgi:LemA protein